MATNLTTVKNEVLSEDKLVAVLQTSLYSGASEQSVRMVLGYCRAAGLDVMQKPVHIVPMWDSTSRKMKDVVMPGIGLYRIMAARTNQCAGIDEPEFGPTVESEIGTATMWHPEWCKITVRRLMPNGAIAQYTAKEFWIENYAGKGGPTKDVTPNAMWTKRPNGQLAKCTEAQALRKAFPELGAQATFEEMEGKELEMPVVTIDHATGEIEMPKSKSESTEAPAPETPKPALDVAAMLAGIEACKTVDEVQALFPTVDALPDGAEKESLLAAGKVRVKAIKKS